MPPLSPEDQTLACTRHADCRVLAGVCGRATPSNAASVEQVAARIEARSRITTCGRGGIAPEDTTGACVDGACRALLGPADDHACAADSECAIVDGPCGPTEAVASRAAGAFAARIEAMLLGGSGCGYGPRPHDIRAACVESICIPEPVGPTPASERTAEELARIRRERASLWVEGHLRVLITLGTAHPVDGATYPTEVVNRQLRGRLIRVQRCYERALQQDPAVEGRMQVDLVVAPEGGAATTSVEISNDELNSPLMTSCLTEQLARFRWPNPSDSPQRFRYELVLRPDVPAALR